MVVYRKLLGKKGCYADLEDWSPTLFRSLSEIMVYSGDDMSETFMQTFRVGYKYVGKFNFFPKENFEILNCLIKFNEFFSINRNSLGYNIFYYCELKLKRKIMLSFF